MTASGSVLIDDMPIPLDWRHQLADFLDVRLPSEEILFARHCFAPKVNPLVCDNAPDYFRSPYPPLPPIEIGEYQCPTGMSRYGRALFVVDWPVLRIIAQKCWGMTTVPPGNDVPINWKTLTGMLSLDHVSLKFNGQDGTIFTAQKMYPLPPHRVPGAGRDLWLLPLVDERYHWALTRYHESIDEPPEDWPAFLGSLIFGLEMDTVPAQYGEVDERLHKTERTQPAVAILDVAALSIGLRPVYDPIVSQSKLINSENSKNIRIRRMAAPWITNPNELSPTSPLIISGGRCGAAMYPRQLKISYRHEESDEWNLVSLPQSGVNFPFSVNVWTSWVRDDSEDEELEEGDPTAEDRVDDFCQKVADDAWGWMDAGGQYCFLGLAPTSRVITPEDHDPGDPGSPQPTTEKLVVCGFDDYFSIQIKEYPKEPGRYAFTHRYYELPPLFLPDVLLVNGKKDECKAGGGESGAMIAWPPNGGIPAAEFINTANLILGSALCRPSIFNWISVGPDPDAELIRVYNTVTSIVGANGPVQCKLGTIKEGNSTKEIWMVDVEICEPSGGGPGPDPNPPLSDLWNEDDDLSLGI